MCLPPLFECLNRLPKLSMVHVSPWSDLQRAVQVYGKEKVIEVAFHSTEDVMVEESRRHRVDERLYEAKKATNDFRAVIRADGFAVIPNPQQDVKRLQHWIERANRILL